MGLARFLRAALRATETQGLGFQYRVTELLDEGAAAAPDGEQLHAAEAPGAQLAPDAEGLYDVLGGGGGGASLRVRAAKLEHRVLCFGFAVTEPDAPGRLDAAAARALGVEGAQLGELKAGRAATARDGARVEPGACLGAPAAGRTALLLGDSLDNSSAAARPCAFLRLPAARGAAVLVHEATFCDASAAHAAPKGHATARQAGALAAELRAARLVLTHLSQRYAPRSAGAAAAGVVAGIEAEAAGEAAARGWGGCAVRAVEDFEVVALRR